MTKDELLQFISSNITDNNSGDITAEKLRNILNSMVEYTPQNEDIDLDGYLYISTATPTTTPVTITNEDKFLYIATEEGDYTNFGLGKIIEMSVIKSVEGSWVKESLGAVFKKLGINLVNPKAMKEGYYCNTQVGGSPAYQPNTAYSATEKIPVKPNTLYSVKAQPTLNRAHFVVEINAEDKVVKYTSDVRTFTTTSSTAYVIITYYTDSSLTYQLAEGDIASYYPYSEMAGYIEEYGTIIKDGSVATEKLADKSVTKEKLSQAVSSKLAYSRFRIHRQGIAAYATLGNVDFPILRGCYVKNNGIDMILGSDASLTQRKNLFSGETWCCEFDVNLIKTFSVAGDVDMDINIPAPIEVDWDSMPNITTEKIADNSVSPQKTDFFQKFKGKNLYNPNSEGINKGVYLMADGNFDANANYFVTDYIPFTQDMGSIVASINGSYISTTGAMWAYNSNFNKTHYIRPISQQGISIIQWQEGDAYVRISVPSTGANLNIPLQVEAGDVITPYEAYYEKTTIKKEYLPEIDAVSSITYFHLPKHIYVAAGRTIELYYEQILLNANRYNIQAQCSIGAALERKFQIIGDESHIGNYTLTIKVYDDNSNLLKEATSTIHIVSNAILEEIKVLPIGDSLTNQKPWIDELKNLSSNKIVTVGTRGSSAAPHEGRSGAAVSTYMSTAGKSVYSFDHNYIGVGSNSEEFSNTQSYSTGEFVKYGNSVYVFIAEHPAGEWATNHVYNITEGNPFYDWETKAWSFAKYKQRNNINPDIIMIYLGTNGINLTPETNGNGALGIKNLIDKIRLEDANTPIIVVNTIFRSGQNGIGKQGNTDGYTAQSEYKFNADRKVLLLAKALDEMIGNYPNVYICPVGFTHDSKYNFGNIKRAVNPRLDVTEDIYEIYPNESVHPQNAGYMQMADEMFSTICAIS